MKNVSNWEINCDGYFPYCAECGYEPNIGYIRTFGFPRTCPNCGAEMENYAELNQLIEGNNDTSKVQ